MAENHHDDPVAREYARHAPVYDERWAFYIKATARETMKRLEMSSADRLLDVGCGSGELLKAAREIYPHAELVGVDLCDEMLDVARRKVGEHATLLHGRADELPFPAESLDMLVSCNCFHYFREPEKSLVEFLRVLKPGGRIVITDWRGDYPPVWLLDRILRLVNRAHHRAYSRRRMRRMLLDAGFEDAHVEPFRISLFWGLMAAKGRKPDRAESPTGG